MKARIGRHIEQRTTLLASVSHDLRTPLTRLKLEVALAEPSPQMARIEGDLQRNGAHGRGVSRLRPRPSRRGPRGARRRRPPGRGGAGRGRARARGWRWTRRPPLLAPVRPLALRRAVTNLVMNAAAHGDPRRAARAAHALRRAGDRGRRRRPGHTRRPAGGGVPPVQPARRQPQSEHQGRRPGACHRARRRPRPRRRALAGRQPAGRPSRDGAPAGVSTLRRSSSRAFGDSARFLHEETGEP